MAGSVAGGQLVVGNIDDDPHPLATCSSRSAEIVRSVSRLSESFRLKAFLFSGLILLIFSSPGFVGAGLIGWLYPRDRKRTAEHDSNKCRARKGCADDEPVPPAY